VPSMAHPAVVDEQAEPSSAPCEEVSPEGILDTEALASWGQEEADDEQLAHQEQPNSSPPDAASPQRLMVVKGDPPKTKHQQAEIPLPPSNSVDANSQRSPSLEGDTPRSPAKQNV